MTIRAAGGVVWRHDEHGLRVAVIHRRRQRDWSLPKGKLDPGEDELAAAVREVGEETGWSVRVGEDLGTIAYRVRGRRKTVRFWALEAEHGAFEANREVDALEWLPPERARERLTYAHDVTVLDRFVRLGSPPP